MMANDGTVLMTATSKPGLNAAGRPQTNDGTAVEKKYTKCGCKCSMMMMADGDDGKRRRRRRQRTAMMVSPDSKWRQNDKRQMTAARQITSGKTAKPAAAVTAAELTSGNDGTTSQMATGQQMIQQRGAIRPRR